MSVIMVSPYIPHKWVVVEFKTNDGEVNRKVMASWYGGYLGSDSWKLSSGITETVEHEDHYESTILAASISVVRIRLV